MFSNFSLSGYRKKRMKQGSYQSNISMFSNVFESQLRIRQKYEQQRNKRILISSNTVSVNDARSPYYNGKQKRPPDR